MSPVPGPHIKHPHLCNALFVFGFLLQFFFLLFYQAGQAPTSVHTRNARVGSTIFFQFDSHHLCTYKKACQPGAIFPVGHDDLTRTCAEIDVQFSIRFTFFHFELASILFRFLSRASSIGYRLNWVQGLLCKHQCPYCESEASWQTETDSPGSDCCKTGNNWADKKQTGLAVDSKCWLAQ